MQEPPEKDLPSLLEEATLRERPFHSDVPLIGPLIAAARELWNSVSTKWYARPIMQQQSAYNVSVARRLEALEEYAYERISLQERELVSLRRERAEQALAVARLQEQVLLLEARLAGQSGQVEEDEAQAGRA